MDKFLLTLVSASKRLKRYFQAHTVIVTQIQTYKADVINPRGYGKSWLKWNFEIVDHDIQYRPRKADKGKILADFIVERPEDNLEDTLMEDAEELPDPWTLFTDGSSCIDGFGAGLILTNPEGMEFTYALRFRFDATNNERDPTPDLFRKDRKGQILDSSYRLLHEVDRSQAGCNHYWKPDQKNISLLLDEMSKNWMEELPRVLWAHRTMIKSSNGDTPFSLTYRTEAVIPAKIGMPTLRTAEVSLEENKEALEINLDLLEERREQATIREAKSKAKMERYYNSKVRSVSFKPGDLVYRNNEASRAEDTGKLGPKWEGPYEVTEALGKGVEHQQP
ncbi:reverse transcriptase domain-containing protein [Tanacetum coccineum]